jgi:NAD-reducing hydrogenase large subunit
MTKKITIDPITRIEGHARITIRLDEKQNVRDARFHVTQFRGFEKFCEGRPMHEMPSITARICGICPVSHMMASGKAGDELLAVRIPRPAILLRRIVNLAQILQSHALSFFHLSAPDLLLGMDADPKIRNVFGLVDSHPEYARKGIRLRQFGQQIIEKIAGKKIHAAWVIPGGVNKGLDAATRDSILKDIPEAKDIAKDTLELFKKIKDNFAEQIDSYGSFPSGFMGLVGPDGSLEHYDGKLRLIDSEGNRLEPDFDPENYRNYIGEAVEPWSYLKFPYYKPQGYPEGIYRVGPLARLNVCEKCGTPEADKELDVFRELSDGPVCSSFYYHYARIIEIIYALERLDELLNDPECLDDHIRAKAEPNSTEGVGVTEAPRGTLIHHYKIDDQGLIRWVNFIIATGHNNLAMNRSITQVAREHVDGNNIEEGMLNRVEAVIRAYDPCLSCSTHAIGQMPLQIRILDSNGEVQDEITRP